MPKSVGFFSRDSVARLMFAALMVSSCAFGQEGGGGGTGASAYEKLEPFTVNLVGLKQIIQVSLTLKLAKAEAGEKVKFYMPVIRHEMILLLSEKTAEEMQSPEGKLRLVQQTKIAVNKATGLDEKEGVNDVLFDSIIIQ